MELIEHIERAWGWTGICPDEVVGENDFGNLIVRDQLGRYWRLCPEDLYCKVVADDRDALDLLIEEDEFQDDWIMRAIVEEARTMLGPLGPGRKYCLRIPGVLGGEYGGGNLASMSLVELVESSGKIAVQINGLPDGARVRFRLTE